MAHASKPAPSPTSRMQPRVHGAFPQVMTMVLGLAEDAGFEPARACTQPASQVCSRPVIIVQATPRGGN
jgi:hypothetical protein